MSDLVNTTQGVFSAGGPLSVLPDFEYRPQQIHMASAIAATLTARSHLIVEAPTGVGKTLAYLVPAVLYALHEGRKAIVSTHTKNLQDQLLHNDIPILRTVIGTDFTAAVIKGRRNYLCTTRLQHALDKTSSLFARQDTHQLERIFAWSTNTRTGELDDLDFIPTMELWNMVCSEQGICSSRTCRSRCFFQQAKERMRSATLIVMNHSLFFTLLMRQENGDRYLFDNDFVILDEAHTIESVAARCLGKTLSRSQVLLSIRRLYNPRTRKGLLGKEHKTIRHLCGVLLRSADEFFDACVQAAVALTPGRPSMNLDRGGSREVRIRTPMFVANTLEAPFRELQSRLEKIAESEREPSIAQELAAAGRALQESRSILMEFLEQPDSENTYWLEMGGARLDNTRMCVAPTTIAGTIGSALFRQGSTVILTSATLSVEGSLEYFKGRIGAKEVPAMVLDSPFDHFRQMKICIAQDIPEPDTESYLKALPTWIMKSVERTDGRALVLFTSSTLMHSVAASLGVAFEQRGITLLVQDADVQRHTLLEAFKRDIRSVLFGVDSFWTGIDVPGEALGHVIITRLPFAVPNHPVVEARGEMIARRGGNAFLEYSLPEAVIKFRQGAGRLLRSQTDQGLLTILDSRIITKQYGRVFVSSLPRCPIEFLRSDGTSEEIVLQESIT